VTAPGAPGWYPDEAQFGFQRYWDGGDWTPSTRLGDGADPSADPLIEPMSLRWLLAWSMVLLIVALLGGLVLALAIGSGQLLGLALVSVTPLLWVLAVCHLVLVSRTPVGDPATATFKSRSRRIIAAAALTPVVLFAVGWTAFN
jgi:hypothetical protein